MKRPAVAGVEPDFLLDVPDGDFVIGEVAGHVVELPLEVDLIELEEDCVQVDQGPRVVDEALVGDGFVLLQKGPVLEVVERERGVADHFLVEWVDRVQQLVDLGNVRLLCGLVIDVGSNYHLESLIADHLTRLQEVLGAFEKLAIGLLRRERSIESQQVDEDGLVLGRELIALIVKGPRRESVRHLVVAGLPDGALHFG